MLVGVCVFTYLASTVHWEYGLAAAGFLAAYLAVARIDGKRHQHELSEALCAAFPATGRPSLDLMRAGGYGWPTITLIFATEADLQQAMTEGSISTFKKAVQALLAYTGSRRNPFDVGRAVQVTVKGKSSV